MKHQNKETGTSTGSSFKSMSEGNGKASIGSLHPLPQPTIHLTSAHSQPPKTRQDTCHPEGHSADLNCKRPLRQLSPCRYSAHASHARRVGPAAVQNERPRLDVLATCRRQQTKFSYNDPNHAQPDCSVLGPTSTHLWSLELLLPPTKHFLLGSSGPPQLHQHRSIHHFQPHGFHHILDGGPFNGDCQDIVNTTPRMWHSCTHLLT